MFLAGILAVCFALLPAYMGETHASEDEAQSGDVVPASYAFNSGNGSGAWQKGGFRIVPYGAFWADMVYATERTNPGPYTLYVLSEELQGESTFAVDARRSRFGIDAQGPAIPWDGGLQSGGRLEIDFYGDFVTENKAGVQLRHAYWEAKNESQRILVGQYWDVISPLMPRTINYSVGWMGGNVGFRRTQFRYERYGAFSDNLAWTLQSSLSQDIVPDFPTDPGVVRESSDWPVFEARYALTLNPEAGARATTLGVSGHIGETGFDFLVDSPPPLNLPPEKNARFETWSYNFDLSTPISRRATLQAEFFRGRNLSPFLGGIGQGVCACARQTIDSIGGWADVQFQCTNFLSTTVGYGIDDPDNDDFLVGRTYNQFIFANYLVNITEALSTGFEVTYWKTLYQEKRVGLVPADELGPLAPGKAVTIDWMVKYAF